MSAALIVGVLMAGGGAAAGAGPGASPGASPGSAWDGDRQSSSAAALVAALTEALGPATSVVVETMPAPSKAAALHLEELTRAAAVATVWDEAPSRAARGRRPPPFEEGLRRVRVGVHVRVGASVGSGIGAGRPGPTDGADGGRWLSPRLMTFRPGDSDVERGRSIGLAVAAMILSTGGLPPPVAQALPASSREGPGAEPGAPPVSSLVTSPVTSPVSSQPAVSATRDVAEASSSVVATRSPSGPPVGARYALEVSGIGSAGVGGPAGGLGSTTHLERAGSAPPGVAKVFWTRAGVGLRGGSVGGLNGDDLVGSATLGGAWRLPGRILDSLDASGTSREGTGLGPGSGLGLALTGEVGALVHVLSHRQSTGSSVRTVVPLPAASVGLAGTWRLGGSWEAQAGLGLELAFGHTEVWVAQSYLTTIPMVRGLATLGVRFGL